jgi:hypothetical protein
MLAAILALRLNSSRKPAHLPDSEQLWVHSYLWTPSVGKAYKVRSVTLRGTMMKNDNKTQIGADIIHIMESDDEVQYVSHKQHGQHR